MAPIAAAFSRDLLKGGKARLGKSAKNVFKAMDKKNNPTVVRYHRTHGDNVANIRKQGLVPNSKNQGRNTGDQFMIPDVVWLGNNPTEIPVLRNLLEQRPEDVTEFKVKIPSDVYYNTPRYKFPNGRGAGKPQLVPNGKPSLSDEGDYKIDMFGGTIPPEYLEEIPIEEITKGIEANRKTVTALTTLLADIDPKVSSRLLDENPQLAKRIGRVSDLENGGWIIGSDKSLGDEIENLMAPISLRYESPKNFERNLERVNDEIGRAMKSPYGQKLFFYTPNQRMRDALQQFRIDSKGRAVIGEYIPPNTKLSDLVPKEDDYGNVIKTPEELGGFSITAPGPDQVAKGSVSHGGSQDWPSLKERRFDYDTYNKNIAQGYPPAVAADFAAPHYKFTIDPDDITGTRWGWYRTNDHKGPNYGMITEGEGNYYAMNRVKNLMDFARQYGLTPDRRAELHDAFQDVLKRETIGSYVPNKNKFSEFTPGSRLPDWDPRR
jgi:hypothetical protein